MIVQHENSLTSWRAGERGRDWCYLGSWLSLLLLGPGLSSASTASGAVLWLTAALCASLLAKPVDSAVPHLI